MKLPDLNRRTLLKSAGGILLAGATPKLFAGNQYNCNLVGNGNCGPGGGGYDYTMFNSPDGPTAQQKAYMIALANKTSLTSADMAWGGTVITKMAAIAQPQTCPQTNLFNGVNYAELILGATLQQKTAAYNHLVAMGFTQTLSTFLDWVCRPPSPDQGWSRFHDRGWQLSDIVECICSLIGRRQQPR